MLDYFEPDKFLYEFPILLASLLDITTNDGWSFFPAKILRFLTFERLEMTHTCCEHQFDYQRYRSTNNYFSVFDENDRVEIQEEESADLKELEKLMLEFQHAYTDLGIPLPEFLQGYWTTRMDEVMSSKEAISEDEVGQIRELGVTWEPREQRCATPGFITSLPEDAEDVMVDENVVSSPPCSIKRLPDDAGDVMVDENVVSRPPVEGRKRRHSF